MDLNRQILNTLMGRDRNKPKGSTETRDHYSNRDVCKPFLVCLCFNTLFPNTTYDQGPCTKRHDAYLKSMFDNDLVKADYERQYIKECISWIQKRLVQVQQKIKKNQAVIDNKSSYAVDRPRQVVDRLLNIDRDIEDLMKKAQDYGKQGRIEQSLRCSEQIDKLKERRRDIELMGDSMNAAQKQQKICEVCGAIQTINDTQKRITMHLQGKIHQGFLKLRHEVETLKVRLQMLNQLAGDKKEIKQEPVVQKHYRHEKQQNHVQKQRQRQRQRQKQKERQRERERERERERQKQHDKQRDRRSSSHGKKKRKDHDREKDRERSRDKHERDSRDRKQRHRDREARDQNRDRDRDRYKHTQKQRENERHKEHKQKKKKDSDKKHKRDKSKSKQRYSKQREKNYS